jgi:anti-sigma regulatory factor (Ser/Thr protein kinase)
LSPPVARAARPSAFRADLAARQSSLNRLLERFEEFARRRRLPSAVRRIAHLALDEIVSNVIRHGSRRASCRIRVDVSIERGVLQIEVVDNGVAFNPLAAAEPKVQGRPANRPIGGLGIHLVRKLVDRLEYSRQKGRNRLLMQLIVDRH